MDLTTAFGTIIESLFVIIGTIGAVTIIIAFFIILLLCLSLAVIEAGRWLLVRIKLSWKRPAEEILANKLFIDRERKVSNDGK